MDKAVFSGIVSKGLPTAPRLVRFETMTLQIRTCPPPTKSAQAGAFWNPSRWSASLLLAAALKDCDPEGWPRSNSMTILPQI